MPTDYLSAAANVQSWQTLYNPMSAFNFYMQSTTPAWSTAYNLANHFAAGGQKCDGSYQYGENEMLTELVNLFPVDTSYMKKSAISEVISMMLER